MNVLFIKIEIIYVLNTQIINFILLTTAKPNTILIMEKAYITKYPYPPRDHTEMLKLREKFKTVIRDFLNVLNNFLCFELVKNCASYCVDYDLLILGTRLLHGPEKLHDPKYINDKILNNIVGDIIYTIYGGNIPSNSKMVYGTSMLVCYHHENDNPWDKYIDKEEKKIHAEIKAVQQKKILEKIIHKEIKAVQREKILEKKNRREKQLMVAANKKKSAHKQKVVKWGFKKQLC